MPSEITTAVVLDQMPDLSAEVTCETCDEDPARWALIQRPCGHRMSVCDGCRDAAIRLHLPATDDVIYGCDRCDHLVIEIDWGKL